MDEHQDSAASAAEQTDQPGVEQPVEQTTDQTEQFVSQANGESSSPADEPWESPIAPAQAALDAECDEELQTVVEDVDGKIVQPTPADATAGTGAAPNDNAPATDKGDDDRSDADETGEGTLDGAAVMATVEAILFAADAPLTPARLVQIARVGGQRIVKQAIKDLNARYKLAGCAFRIELIAGGYQMLTQPQYHEVLARLFRVRNETKLSPAAMETLAIIAYRQPVIRADIEAVRGVASGEVLRSLMERQLVKIVGRAQVLGRPMLYGTTKRFLEVFGLGGLEDLPRVEELRGGATAVKMVPRAGPAPSETASEQAPQAQSPTPDAPSTGSPTPDAVPVESATTDAPPPDPADAQEV